MYTAQVNEREQDTPCDDSYHDYYSTLKSIYKKLSYDDKSVLLAYYEFYQETLTLDVARKVYTCYTNIEGLESRFDFLCTEIRKSFKLSEVLP